ncbi:MAG: GNAT family N-acyltransferase [Roseovarius sp.]
MTDLADTTPLSGLSLGRFEARVAMTAQDKAAAQALRAMAFGAAARDCDALDRICMHVLIEDRDSGALVCCFRMLHLSSGADIARSYSAQFYDLCALTAFAAPMVELGRFCIHPDWNDPDILRVAWGMITRYVDENKIEMLFGCSSFKGTDDSNYTDAFALLKDRYLAPAQWRPRIKSADVFGFAQALRTHPPDMRAAMQAMPPLLRTYLMMGGWVSDHAVVDTHMNTLHVFTGLEIAAIPAARKRLLRAVAQ